MKSKSAFESRHLGLVKLMACCIPTCGKPPVSEAQHITHSGRRLGDLYTIPLCVSCHRGNDGFDGTNREAWVKSFVNQLHLMMQIYKALPYEPPASIETKVSWIKDLYEEIRGQYYE